MVSSLLNVSSPTNWQYTVFDRNGRQVAKGQLTNGQNFISTGALAGGLYLINFYNNSEQYTEKFMKR
jgi:hypothetical protein